MSRTPALTRRQTQTALAHSGKGSCLVIYGTVRDVSSCLLLFSLLGSSTFYAGPQNYTIIIDSNPGLAESGSRLGGRDVVEYSDFA